MRRGRTIRFCKLIGVLWVLLLVACPHAFGGGGISIDWCNDGSLTDTNSPLFSDSDGLTPLSAGLTNYIGDGYLIQLVALQGGTNYILGTATVGDYPGAIWLSPFDGSFATSVYIDSNTLAGAVGSPIGLRFFDSDSIDSATAYGVVSNLTITVPSPEWFFPPFPMDWALDYSDTNFMGPRTTANGGFYTDTAIDDSERSMFMSRAMDSDSSGCGTLYIPPVSLSSSDEESGGGGFTPDSLSSSCSITNLTQAFFITGIGTATNRSTTITWQSCPVFRYIVYSADGLNTNTAWLPRVYVWGQTNASTTSWTDTSTTNSAVTARFYKVRRILGSPIASGGAHSVVLAQDGKLWTWGSNEDGELGDGLNLDIELSRPYHGEVADLIVCPGQTISNRAALAAGGEDFTVFADADGIVWTCGENSKGELGSGAIEEDTPSTVYGISNVVNVTAGAFHVLALRADETVWAWGDNEYGQLGAGGVAAGYTISPTQALVVTQVVAIAAGSYHSVALQQNGTVWAWGYNSQGQLGDGSTTNRSTPAPVGGISNVIAVAAGALHTVALTADKTLWTWGGNFRGQLGDGTTNNRSTPAQVAHLSNVVAIAAGTYYTIAANTSGQVYAWGSNRYGQLGTNNLDVLSTNRPMVVAGISNAVLVSASLSDCLDDSCDESDHSMAMTLDGGTNHFWAWGFNEDGEVGNGTNYLNETGSDVQDTPVEPQFCTRCQRCVQLGTTGSFTAECNGTMYLYFNDDQTAFGDNGTNSFSVTFHAAGQTNLLATVMGANSGGVAISVVTNGGVYFFSASGFCQRDIGGDKADPDGNDQHTNQVDCSFVDLDITNAVCPARKCFSLVGKIR